ncbi:hypothetical protein GGQ04_002720 [Salinibacter ruber]|nr:hypothetical protein [Salinibacter ruber]
MGLAVSSIGSVTFRFTAPKIVWDVVSNAPVVSDSRAETIPPHNDPAPRLCGGSLFLQKCIPEERTPQERTPQERAPASVSHVSDVRLHLMSNRF